MSDIKAAAEAQIRQDAKALADTLVRSGLDGIFVDAVGMVMQYREKEVQAALRVQSLLNKPEDVSEASVERLTTQLRASRSSYEEVRDKLQKTESALGHSRAVCAELRDGSKELKQQLDEVKQELEKALETLRARPPLVVAGTTLERDSATITALRSDLQFERRRARESWEAQRLEHQDFEQAQRDLAEARKQVEEKNIVIASLQRELRDSRDEARTVHNKCSEWKQKLEHAQNELSETRNEWNKTTQALARCKEELISLAAGKAVGASQGVMGGDIAAPYPPATTSRRAAWRHYAGFAMTSRAQFALNQIMEIADKVLEAEEERFGIFK